MYGGIAKKFHEKFIGGELNSQTMEIAYQYVKFIIDAYEDAWNDYAKTYENEEFDEQGESD